jgi:transglutaminase-like putative cysteine protease
VSGDVRDARFFDADPFAGTTEYFYFDPDTDGFTIETRQDVEPLLESNKRLWNASEKHTRYSEWTLIASIPPVIILQLAKQGILGAGGAILDDKRYRAWLNDPANLLFRTRAGKV